MEHIVHIAAHWTVIHKDDLLALVGGAGGLSVLLESGLLKLKRKWNIDNSKLAYVLIHGLTALSALSAYVLSNMSYKDILPIYGTLVIAAQTWHRFVVSGTYTKYVIPFLDYLGSQKPASDQVSTENPTPTDQPDGLA